MMPKLPILVFDFGAVLLDWNVHYLYDELFNGDAAAVDAFLEEIHFSEWNARQDAGNPFARAVEEHSRKYPHWAEMISAYDTRWMDMMRGDIQPTVELMLRLQRSGYSAWALSNWSLEKFRQVRPQHPFLEKMDGIVISGEVGVVKPDESIYRILLNRVGQPAHNCLFIDDSMVNIEAARKLGFQTILYRSPKQLEEDLKEKGIA